MTPRSILFVDGENLTIRYQEMLAAGRKPKTSVEHKADVYVWHTKMTYEPWAGLPNLIRVHYYTSVTGDQQLVEATQRELSQINFVSQNPDRHHQGQLVPMVFKKERKSKKTRNVDIQMIVDVMRYVFTDAIDRVYLATGDGDFLPLISEVMARGKQVELLALSSGLSPRLRSRVDRLHLLDDTFFEAES
jgi:uncharacterized LabA/DUF88 family protein